MEAFQEGAISFIDEDYAAALGHFNKACDECTTYAPAFACRAAVLLKEKKYSEALEDCNRAATLDPNHEANIFRKGYNYIVLSYCMIMYHHRSLHTIIAP